MVQVRIRTTDTGIILDELTGRIAATPQFFDRTAVCVDLSALRDEPRADELNAVFDAVRRAGLLAAGISHDNIRLDELARAVNMPVLTQFRPQRRPATAPKAVETPPAAEPALMHHQPVRSGQRIYARQRDLIVTTTVGAGAEVMADGCVHVYAALRGRAMAGVRGDTTARVFCQQFNAALVSIAGVFRVFETLPDELAGQPVQAWLEGEDLRFARIGG